MPSSNTFRQRNIGAATGMNEAKSSRKQSQKESYLTGTQSSSDNIRSQFRRTLHAGLTYIPNFGEPAAISFWEIAASISLPRVNHG